MHPRRLVPVLLNAAQDAVILLGADYSVASGTEITITDTSSGDLSAGVFGVVYSISPGSPPVLPEDYVYSRNVPGAVANQEITIGALEGISLSDTVYARPYYNLDPLDPTDTRVYGTALTIVLTVAEAQLVINAMSPAPSAARHVAINALVVALKAAGVWAKCDRIWVLGAHNDGGAAGSNGLINWKAPGTDNLTISGSPTWTEDRGFTGDGAAAKLINATNYNAMTQYQQNDAHIALWSLSSALEAKIHVGCDGSSDPSMRPRTTSNVASYRLNGTQKTVAVADGLGFYVGTRPDSGNVYLFKNGSQIATAADTSGARVASPVTVLKGATEFSAQQVSFVSIGASLNAEAADYYAAVLAYMQHLGAA